MANNSPGSPPFICKLVNPEPTPTVSFFKFSQGCHTQDHLSPCPNHPRASARQVGIDSPVLQSLLKLSKLAIPKPACLAWPAPSWEATTKALALIFSLSLLTSRVLPRMAWPWPCVRGWQRGATVSEHQQSPDLMRSLHLNDNKTYILKHEDNTKV